MFSPGDALNNPCFGTPVALPRARASVNFGVRIGCSGWVYASWRGAFYPADLPASEWLPFYASRFDTVEVNGTFYRLPEADTFLAWRRALPVRFLAAIKASRFLTHLKRLKDPEGPVERLFSRACGLGSRLGPVLYQLPANFVRTPEHEARLQDLLTVLPRGRRRHVIEFRDRSWYDAEVFALIDRAGAAVCWHDMPGSELDESPGRLAYIRFHGTTRKYGGDYSREVLASWSRRIRRAAASRPVYAYFNNDIDGAAVRNAETLRALCR
jgi:uncharacterized protein YecE (DUF72 family)